jgi:hypothetical protein
MEESGGRWWSQEPFAVGLLILLVVALIVAMTGFEVPNTSEELNGLKVVNWTVDSKEEMAVYHVTLQNTNGHEVDESVRTVICQGDPQLESWHEQYHQVHLKAFETKTFVFIVFQEMSGDEEFACGF